MTDKRKQTKAMKEIEETRILVDYLLHHELSFEDENNFSDLMVRRSREWYDGRRNSDYH